MTFLAPGVFFASLAVAAAVVALHFIVTRQPRAGILPTARFIPEMPATATARARRPSDLLLLLLRVLLVLAAGAGLARPVLKPSRDASVRLILADVSRNVKDVGALRDSVRSLYRDRDAIILFDSSARALSGGIADSIATLTVSDIRGNLSGALLAAVRMGSALREVADSIELVVVSPLGADEADAATESIRRLWPGSARVVTAGRASGDAQAVLPEPLRIRGAANDPLLVTARLTSSDARATIIRDGSTIPDSVTAAPTVDWPVSVRPRDAVARVALDTIGGVLAGKSLVVASFERKWSYPPDSIDGAEVIARWIDGEPAAVEWKSGEACVRSVAIPVTPIGDLVIRNDFIDLVGALAAKCVGQQAFVPMSAAGITALEGTGGLAPREAFRPRGDTHSWLSTWLLGIAILAAIAELFVRRRKAQATTISRPRETRMESAA